MPISPAQIASKAEKVTQIFNILSLVILIVGGLGFPVLWDLYGRRGTPWRDWWSGLTFHSKVTVSATAGLLVGGTLLILLVEQGNALAGMGLGDQVMNAAFQSATPRTFTIRFPAELAPLIAP